MEYRRPGSTDVSVSPLSLVTWRFGTESAQTLETDRETDHDLLVGCWEHGSNFVDTAYSDGGESEEWIGEWLSDHDREEFVVASEVYWWTRGVPRTSRSRKAIRSEIDDTLERFEITQPRFIAASREEVADDLDVCADRDLAVRPSSPLEGGFLTVEYERDGDPPSESRGDPYGWERRFDERQWRLLPDGREVADEADGGDE